MGEFIGKSLSPQGKRYQSFERCAWHDFPQNDITTIINQFIKRLRMVKEVEGKHIEHFFSSSAFTSVVFTCKFMY